MTITGGSGISKDDIERMMKDAEAHADEDRQKREEAEVRNTGESLVYQTEKFLKENEDKVPAEGKQNVEEALTTLRKALEGTDIAAITAASEAVAQASQSLGAAMYEQQQAQGAGAGEGTAADEEVIDAEVVDEDTKA